MAVVTETVTTNAGGGENTTTVAAEGSLTKRPGGTPLTMALVPGSRRQRSMV